MRYLLAVLFVISETHAVSKGTELGKVFQISGRTIEVIGAKALKQGAGTRVLVETKTGLLEVTIKEQFHTKAKVLVSDPQSKRITAGDKVFALGKVKKVDANEKLRDVVRAPLPAGMRAEEKEEWYTEWLEKGADVNYRDQGGYTPLMWAAMFGRNKAVSALVKAGADINARGGHDQTALIFGVHEPEIAALLLEYGADTDHVSAVGESALMRLAELNNQEQQKSDKGRSRIEESITTAKLLLHHGANINLADQDGKTALSKAQAKGNTMFVEFLIKNGAR